MTGEVYALDEFGNRLIPVTINTICPVELAEQGRAVCQQFMADCEDVSEVAQERMLEGLLYPVNGFDPTHVFCSRSGYSHQVERLRGYMKALRVDHVSPGISTVHDDPRDIKAKLSVMVGDKEDVLQFLGLREAV